MKKLLSTGFGAALLISIIFISGSENAVAQRLAFEEGDKVLRLGFGLGGGFYTGTLEVPPIQGNFEYAVTEDISVGGIIGYASSYYQMYGASGGGIGGINYSYLLIGGRGNYHFATSDRWDPYAGITLGYNNITFTDNTQNSYTFISPATSMVLYGAQVGSNYYFTENFGAWAEIGYGIGVLNIGAAYKF